MKDEIRALLEGVIEELDVLEENGLDRTWLKKQVAKIRKQVSRPLKMSKNKPLPSIEQLHQHLVGGVPSFLGVYHFLHLPGHHSFKKEYAQVIYERLSYIDRFTGDILPPHKDYGPALSDGNFASWIDQYGLNVLESQRSDAIKFRERYKKEHGKLPYAHEVRRSDEVIA